MQINNEQECVTKDIFINVNQTIVLRSTFKSFFVLFDITELKMTCMIHCS